LLGYHRSNLGILYLWFLNNQGMSLKHFFSLLLLIISGNLFSQDIHFSQFYNALLNVNPALTGVGAKPARIGLVYRNQWNSISTPYKTYTGFADGRFSIKGLYRTWFGIGVAAYNDRSGDGVLSNTVASVSFSVTRGFNRDNTLLVSMGFSLGLLNRSVQFANLVFDEQWNGVKFDPGLSNNEPTGSQSVMAPDFSFGVNGSYAVNNGLKLEAGGSLHHINKPKTSFYDADNRIDMKMIAHARMELELQRDLIFAPAVFYSVQANTQEIIFGGNLLYRFSNLQLIGGLWYRWGRDVIPAIGFNYQLYKFTISYDINVSAMHPASNYQGGVELSLVRVFRKKTNRYPCSEFK